MGYLFCMGAYYPKSPVYDKLLSLPEMCRWKTPLTAPIQAFHCIGLDKKPVFPVAVISNTGALDTALI